MPCYSPLKGWRDAEGKLVFKGADGEIEAEVACGQCLGCRLDRSRMWAIRLVHEASLHEYTCGNSFVTLTYRDPVECNSDQLAKGLHVPSDWSLHKSHFQKFMKRLRKRFPQKIRFFHCGEYGNRCKHGLLLDQVKCPLCNVGRPHYHAILFNCSFPDLEVYTTKNGENRYTSQTLEDIWQYGFVDVGAVNFESAAYVARYALKKVTGVMADEHYTSISLDGEMTYLQPEYCTMSRKPGIARAWYEKYKGDCFPADECPVVGAGVLKKVPRYYEELFKMEDPITHEEIKQMRAEFRAENAEEYSPARLMQKYKVKKAQTEMLKRTV